MSVSQISKVSQICRKKPKGRKKEESQEKNREGAKKETEGQDTLTRRRLRIGGLVKVRLKRLAADSRRQREGDMETRSGETKQREREISRTEILRQDREKEILRLIRQG